MLIATKNVIELPEETEEELIDLTEYEEEIYR